MDSRKLKLIFPVLAAALLILIALPAAEADPQTAPSQEAVKRRIERQKAFLLRSSDELNKTLAFVEETVAVLISQVEAAAGREPENSADERLVLLDWYQHYADWVKGRSAEMDLLVSRYYSRQKAGAGWAARFGDVDAGFRKLAGQAGSTVQKLEGEKGRLDGRMQKLNLAVRDRRVLIDKDDLELARELWPTYRVSYERREAIYKELTDEEVNRLSGELVFLGERRIYFGGLAELARYEQLWLAIRSEEFARQHELAKAISGNDPEAEDYAVRNAIRTYEADIAALKRRSAELDGKLHGITRSGTLRTLDLLEELSRYYDNMKSRYDRHIDWLSGQVGSCQADLVEIAKDL